MQQYVQKSSKTIFPLSCARSIGPELIQPTPPSRLGTASWPKEANWTWIGAERSGIGRLRGLERKRGKRAVNVRPKNANRPDATSRRRRDERWRVMPENLMVAGDLECDARSYPE